MSVQVWCVRSGPVCVYRCSVFDQALCMFTGVVGLIGMCVRVCVYRCGGSGLGLCVSTCVVGLIGVCVCLQVWWV